MTTASAYRDHHSRHPGGYGDGPRRIHTLQYLHLLPFTLGPMAFFGFDLWGAILWAITTFVWAWVGGAALECESAGLDVPDLDLRFRHHPGPDLGDRSDHALGRVAVDRGQRARAHLLPDAWRQERIRPGNGVTPAACRPSI